jgi:hypothetical protein
MDGSADWHGLTGLSCGSAASDTVRDKEDRSRPSADAVRCAILGKGRRDCGLASRSLEDDEVEKRSDGGRKITCLLPEREYSDRLNIDAAFEELEIKLLTA